MKLMPKLLLALLLASAVAMAPSLQPDDGQDQTPRTDRMRITTGAASEPVLRGDLP